MDKINLFFWQNCVSPHQIPYIKELCKDERVEEVFLIVPRTDYEMRKNMGWNAESLLKDTSIKYYLTPNEETANGLLKKSTEKSFHFFSGIRADADVYHWFLLSLSYQIKRGIITEAPFTYNKPLWMHYVRFYLQDKKYIDQINYIYAIGENAVDYYSRLSQKWKVIPFIYCTDKVNPVQEKVHAKEVDEEVAKFVYIGSLSKRKNVISLLRAVALLSDKSSFKLDIIGGGKERAHLETFVAKLHLSTIVNFRGILPMETVNESLNQYDIVVLPSKYDGWGAVINEALNHGRFAICSDECGAKILLKNERLGKVFKTDSPKDLARVISECILNVDIIRKDVPYRKNWSKNIEGKNIATYFTDNICNIKQTINLWSRE